MMILKRLEIQPCSPSDAICGATNVSIPMGGTCGLATNDGFRSCCCRSWRYSNVSYRVNFTHPSHPGITKHTWCERCMHRRKVDNERPSVCDGVTGPAPGYYADWGANYYSSDGSGAIRAGCVSPVNVTEGNVTRAMCECKMSLMSAPTCDVHACRSCQPTTAQCASRVITAGDGNN